MKFLCAGACLELSCKFANALTGESYDCGVGAELAPKSLVTEDRFQNIYMISFLCCCQTHYPPCGKRVDYKSVVVLNDTRRVHLENFTCLDVSTRSEGRNYYTSFGVLNVHFCRLLAFIFQGGKGKKAKTRFLISLEKRYSVYTAAYFPDIFPFVFLDLWSQELLWT